MQRATIDALAGRLPEDASQALLKDIVERPGVEPYTRGRAAMALARVGDVSTLAAVQAAYRAEDEGWRAAPCLLAENFRSMPSTIEAGAKSVINLRV